MLQSQVHAFVVLSLAGVAAGLLYDLLRVVRRRLMPGEFLAAVADLCFWGVVTLVLGAAVLAGNWGELRLYVWLALVTGAGLYFWLASPTVLWMLEVGLGWAAAVARAVVNLTDRLLLGPLEALALFLWRGAGAVAGVLLGPVRWMVRRAAGRWAGWREGWRGLMSRWWPPPEPPGAGQPPLPPAPRRRRGRRR